MEMWFDDEGMPSAVFRDYAKAALTGLLAGNLDSECDPRRINADAFADISFRVADAMMRLEAEMLKQDREMIKAESAARRQEGE